jgi:hypothetical protein
MRLIQTFTAFALFVCFSENAYAEMDGLGFGIVFLVIAIMIIAPPWVAMLIGMFINRKLIQKGYSNTISVVIGLATTLSLLSIPFLDYPYKKMQINEYCGKEGGFHISKTVSGVDGIFGLARASDYGYQYGEVYRNPSDKSSLRRIYGIRTPKGGFLETKPDKPSTFGFRETSTHVEGSIYRVELQTYLTDTGELLGRYVNFESYGHSDPNISFINGFRFWMRMSCPATKKDNGIYNFLPELLQRTLQPAALDSALASEKKRQCEEDWKKYKVYQECSEQYKTASGTLKADSLVHCGVVFQPVRQCN